MFNTPVYVAAGQALRGGHSTPLQVELGYDFSEGSRLVDMGRATIASAMATFVGERPNLGC